jgi:uncharacterized protein YdaU (DUF1376 family)
MANKKDAHYLRHDYNAAQDPKLINVRRDHGTAGYGIYWLLIEWLRQQKNGKVKCDEISAFIFNAQADKTATESIINDYKLFIVDNGCIFSERLNRDTNSYNSMKTKRIEAGKKGGASKALANSKQSSSKALANSKQPSSSKVKNSKVKKSKEENSKEEKDTTAISISSPEKKKEKRIYPMCCNELYFAGQHFLMLQEKSPRSPKPNMQKWAQGYDKIFRIDKRDTKEVRVLLEWVFYLSDFWWQVIRSPDKLREKYVQIYDQWMIYANGDNWRDQ